jgi:hypothetical protein
LQLRKFTLPQRLTLALRKSAIQQLQLQLANLLETHAETLSKNRAHLATEALMKSSVASAVEERTRLKKSFATQETDLKHARSLLKALQSQLVGSPLY